MRSPLFQKLAGSWLPGKAPHKLWRVLPTVVYMAAIFYVSSLPPAQLPVPPGWDDRLLHFLAYFGLGLLLMFSAAAFGADGWPAGRYLMAGTIGILYGASDEWHQSFVPGREASMIDLAFDALGVVTALIAVRGLLGEMARS